jgi:hypothetical protein
MTYSNSRRIKKILYATDVQYAAQLLMSSKTKKCFKIKREPVKNRTGELSTYKKIFNFKH